MRAKEMYPLCCLSLESPGIGVQSPEVRPGSSEGPPTGSAGALQVAGVLFKWTNYSKGWRSRWVLLRNGVLSYSKIYLPENLTLLTPANDVRLIGDLTADRVTRTDSACARRKQQKTAGVVHLKQVLSFRESKSDNRKFYIFTATKTLHLRTNSKRDRVAWIQALVSSRSLFSPRPLNDSLLLLPSDLSVSTERLKKRLAEEGIGEGLVKDCEQIMISEFSQMQGQLQVLCEERSSLLDTLRQLEAANTEGETSGIHDSEYQLSKFSSLGHGKSSECSTTESSDDIEKHYLEVSDEETFFYDTEECFDECTTNHKSTIGVLDNTNKADDRKNHFNNEDRIYSEKGSCKSEFLGIVRRKKLPDPVEKEKGVSLWCMIKDNVGKDLTRVCLPVYFNEPISSLQKCFEDLEYSYLLDRAYDYGRAGNTLLRALNVAAFAVSGYASSEGRHRKPFNPLLGETYEADYPEKGVRFFSEKVSHHPTVIACHCEGRGWKFWGDSNIRTKFWGRSIQLDPVGILTLEFDDGEIFQWSKVTTTIYNLILGKVYCDHHGTMNICGNRDYSCKLKFKERSLLERNPCQVHGFVHDVTGKKGAIMYGKWDDSMYHIIGDGTHKSNELNQSAGASLLWRRTAPPSNLTQYNLTSFAITLNELTPGLKEKLPPTDSRLRPDQRHLENGEYEKANEEKLRLERRQRMSKTLQENGWKPRWFEKDGEDETFRYVGGYWEARERGRWDGCPDIFSEFGEELATSQES